MLLHYLVRIKNRYPTNAKRYKVARLKMKMRGRLSSALVGMGDFPELENSCEGESELSEEEANDDEFIFVHPVDFANEKIKLLPMEIHFFNERFVVAYRQSLSANDPSVFSY